MATAGEDEQRGRGQRAVLKRSEHAELVLPERDVLATLQAQHEDRLADLVPVRIGRMLQSPFAYYRGTAAVMAHDLRGDRVTGTRVVCCGDAHISNFGVFASPERRVLFDLNDFDEASTGPWEWDVKRLAASVVVGGRDAGMSEADCRDAAERCVAAYRTTLAALFEVTAIERHFLQVETDWLEGVARSGILKVLRTTVRKARARTSEQALAELTVTSDEHGALRIRDIPPVTRHLDGADLDGLRALLRDYVRTVPEDIAVLLSQFTLQDFVLRVVGVGSVGTRCYLLLLVGPAGEPLFLQAKEARRSVLETHGGQPVVMPGDLPAVTREHQGFRVVAGQRILQAQSDRFLGYVKAWEGTPADRGTSTCVSSGI